MRFISALVASALAAVAVAQTGSESNPFTNSDYTGIATGTPITLTWTPTTDGTVTIELVQGDPGALKFVNVIQGGLENSGSYEWTPDPSIVESTDYALKIVDDNNPDNYNYTPRFTITSDTKTSSVVPSSTTEAPTSTEEPTTSTDATTTATDATTTDASTTGESSTLATTTTSSPTTSTSQPSSSSSAAAATARVGAGLVGFVGAAMLLL